MSSTRDADVTLVTGFPAFTARRMVKKILESDRRVRLYLLVRAKFRLAAEEFLAALDSAGASASVGVGSGATEPAAPPGPAAIDARRRVTVLEGDVLDMDLGLSGAEHRALAAEVTTIHHLAAIYFPGVTRDVAERVNVEGTRAVLELAGECARLRRLCHYSTAQVSGRRSGVVLEEELDEGQRWNNVYEETKFRAEKLVQAARGRLPITVFRPGIIVGDSKTGEIDRFDGPYYLTVLIVTSPVDVHLPLPGRGSAPLHLVPIDFVVDAAWALSEDPRAAGRTFHLVDPSPFSARAIYAMIAQQAGRKAPRGSIPTAFARAILKAPGIDRLARAPLAFIESFNQNVLYNCRNATALLEEQGLRCPPFDGYVEHLVRYVRDQHEARRQKLEDETFDPFD